MYRQGANKLGYSALTSAGHFIPPPVPGPPSLLQELRAFRLSFEQKYCAAVDQGDAAAEISALASILENINAARDCYQEADPWLERAVEKLEPLTVETVSMPLIRLAAVTFQVTLFRRPWQHTMAPLVELLERCLVQPLPATVKLAVGMPLASYHFWLGRGVRTEIVLDQLRLCAQDSELPPQVQIAWQLTLSFCNACADDDGPKCVAAACEGLRLADKLGFHGLDGRLYAMASYGALIGGDRTTAHYALTALRETNTERRGWDEAGYHWMSSWLCAMEGDPLRVVEYGQEGVKAGHRSGAPFPIAMAQLYLASARVLNNEIDAACGDLGAARTVANQIGSPGFLFACGLLDAAIGLRRDQADQAKAALQDALHLGREQHLDKSRILPATIVAELCAEALAADIETEYVHRVIASGRLTPNSRHTTLEPWPWQVKIYTLGRWSFVLDGVAVEFQVKAQRRPVELLKAIIAFGGRAVPLTELSDALWPDSEGDAAMHNLEMALKRLRALVKMPDIVRMQDGKVSLDAKRCWVDAWSFERGLREASNPEQLAHVLALYHGPFLGRETQPWMLSMRERLRSAFLRHVAKLGRGYEDQRRYDAAIAFYQRSLAVEPLAEEVYRRLMVCYDCLGQRAEAVSTYRCCRETLNAHLNIEPSPATQAIYRQIATDPRA